MKKIIILALICAISIAAYFYFTAAHDAPGSAATAENPLQHDAAVGAAPASKPSASAPVPSPEDLKLPPQLPAYRCDESKCDGAINGAKYEKEAKWLVRNGYPNDEQLRALNGMSTERLLQLADRGDRAARVVAGEKLIANGQHGKGIDQLHKAMFEGSVYASYAIANAFLAAGGSNNPVEAAAYYRLAYLQGDWKASNELYRRVPDLDLMQREMADKRAMRLLENMNRMRAKQGTVIPWSTRPMSYDS